MGLCVLASDCSILMSKELTSSRYGIAVAALILADRSPPRRATFPEGLERVSSRSARAHVTRGGARRRVTRGRGPRDALGIPDRPALWSVRLSNPEPPRKGDRRRAFIPEGRQSLRAAGNRADEGWTCPSASSRFLFGHGETLALRGGRGLLACFSGFAFASFWLSGELESEEVAVWGVDSTSARRRFPLQWRRWAHDLISSGGERGGGCLFG